MIERQLPKKCYKSKEELVDVIFRRIGFKSNLKSTKYLTKAMLIYIDKPNQKFELGIYPIIANEFKVKPECVKKTISFAIKGVWTQCPMRVVEELCDHPMFTQEMKIPTAKQFFFMVRRWVLKQMQT